MKNNTRMKLLNSAFVLFSTKGYHATSLFDVAITAGLRQGAIYYYFRTKDALRDAVMNDVYRNIEPMNPDLDYEVLFKFNVQREDKS